MRTKAVSKKVVIRGSRGGGKTLEMRNRIIAERVGLQLSAGEELVTISRQILVLMNKHVGARYGDRLRAAIKRWDDACKHGK